MRRHCISIVTAVRGIAATFCHKNNKNKKILTYRPLCKTKTANIFHIAKNAMKNRKEGRGYAQFNSYKTERRKKTNGNTKPVSPEKNYKQ